MEVSDTPMSNTEISNDRDQKSGRFLAGNNGGGRKPGSRAKLGELFVSDLRDAWSEHGAEALRRCAEEEPGQFCRIVASLLPKDVNINMSVDVSEFASRFRTALELLGNPEPLPKPRKPMRVINNAG
jgi:hypothetical protein